MRHGRWDRAETDPLADAEGSGGFAHRARETRPAVVRLGSDEDEEVASSGADEPDPELRPVELGQAAVDDVERRSSSTVVEDAVGVEGDHDLTAGRDQGRSRGCGAARVDPAIERDDQRWRRERPGVPELKERHADRIGAGRDAAPDWAARDSAAREPSPAAVAVREDLQRRLTGGEPRDSGTPSASAA